MPKCFWHVLRDHLDLVVVLVDRDRLHLEHLEHLEHPEHLDLLLDLLDLEGVEVVESQDRHLLLLLLLQQRFLQPRLHQQDRSLQIHVRWVEHLDLVSDLIVHAGLD